MSKSQIFIPKKINVGYQEREDTYTKRLAYIIYYDNKGVLRKETSWQGWRDKKIDNNEFDNIPTEGFVLNKGVGGQRHSYGWNARNEYIRVYDPRNFEFEISVANLLWILQECTSTKGKGLEGEFIYGWEGKELILMPVSTKEYDDCVEFTNIQDGKVSARELVAGRVYRDRTMEDWVYLGKQIYYEHASEPYNNSYGGYRNDYYKERYEKEMKKWKESQKGQLRHVFIAAEKKNWDKSPYYYFPTSMTTFKQCVNEIPVDNYAELLQNFQENCKHAAPFVTTDFRPVTKKDLKQDLTRGWGSNRFYLNGERQRCRPEGGETYNPEGGPKIESFEYMSEKQYYKLHYNQRDQNWTKISKEDFMKTFTTKRKIYTNNYTENVH